MDSRLVSSYLCGPLFSFRIVDSSMITVTAYAFLLSHCRLISHLVILGL